MRHTPFIQFDMGHGVNQEAIALLAAERNPMTYQALNSLIRQKADEFTQFGIKRNDRVALVLPNGPEAVAAFLAVAAIATCAPLNPFYSKEEFKFYLGDIQAKAVIVAEKMATAAPDAARDMGIEVIRVRPVHDREAGAFEIVSSQTGDKRDAEFAQLEDIALVLHTSGTTGRPKIVPLSHDNLYTSAVNITKSLSLSGNDRCLNIMPLFHVHGLIGAVLSSLLAGGSVVCTPGFDAAQLFHWLAQCNPTWYTAVPSMHQSILACREKLSSEPKHSLRFIRSCSSPLPPSTAQQLENIFSVPVVEAYGMTEAAHQMTINPLPPGQRKPGSVGQAAGCQIAIMDQAGHLLGSGMTGEVVVRGENVIQGYENNPQANQTSFSDRWFRTGDQGYLDAEGYLFLNGRLKEIINRGGEKISPREVDEVLLRHPGILQAASFAVRHPILGEDLAVAVVTKQGVNLTEKEVRQFAANSLAYHKVPSRVVFVPEIPKGPTGKVQRVHLAKQLGVVYTAQGPEETKALPQTDLEKRIREYWLEVFGTINLGVEDDFFSLGGNSIQAMQIIARIRDNTGITVKFTDFFNAPTIMELAAFVGERIAEHSDK